MELPEKQRLFQASRTANVEFIAQNWLRSVGQGSDDTRPMTLPLNSAAGGQVLDATTECMALSFNFIIRIMQCVCIGYA